MNPADDLPFTESLITRSSLVAECVIAPEKTRLLEFAEQQHCKIQTGIPMLKEQMAMMLEFMTALTH